MAIEVELRGIITENKYNEVISFLDNNADSKNVDDLKADFFILPDQNLKVAYHTTQNYAKIVLKTSKISSSSSKEIEIPIDTNDYDKAIEMFKYLGFNHIVPTDQKRINYVYKDAQISMKWSEGWQFHFEIEKCVKTKDQASDAENEIRSILKELGLKPMTKKEIEDHCIRITGKK